MHFILTPVGSSGDVNPYVGVGAALRRRGHDVTVLASGVFEQLVRNAGLEYVETATSEEYHELASNPDLWHPRKGLRLVLESIGTVLRRWYDLIDEVYRDGESVLVGHTLAFATRTFEERHNAPAATLQLAPSVFRSDFEIPTFSPGWNPAGLPVPVKRAMFWAIDTFGVDPYIVPALNRFRAEKGLGPVARPFNGWSNSPQRVIGLFPDWFAQPQPDWPAALRLTGFPLFDDAGTRGLHPDLISFLEEGEPPIVFTPGSANRHARHFFATAVEAVTRLRRRALLVTGQAEQIPATLPVGVRYEAYVPFSLLLKHCAALVHHGGIGTSAQGLAAGIPHLIMPLGFDQPDNAARLVRLGVADWLWPKRFSPTRVAEKLRYLLSRRDIAAATRRWASQMAAEDPINETCALLEEVSLPMPVSGRPETLQKRVLQARPL